MVKDLLVRISASMSGLKKGLDDAVKVTQTSANKIDGSSKQISDSLNNAFTGTFRNSISELNDLIQTNRDRLIAARAELQRLQAVLRGQKKGTQEFEATERAVKKAKNAVQGYTRDVAELNVQLRDQKTNLANSRLAAEDNSSAMESLSRITTAVTGAVLLLGDGNEKLQPIMKGVRIAVAALNAVVAIQNLRLRENALFANLASSAFNGFKKVVASSTLGVTLLKNALASIVITGVIIGLKLFYDSLSTLNNSLNTTGKKLRLNKDDLKESADEYGKSIAKVERYIQVIADQTINENDRLNALKALKKEYPQYQKYLVDDINNTNALNNAKKQIINLLAKEAILKAAQKKVEDLSVSSTNKYLIAVNNTKRILQDRANIQKQLNDENSDAAKNSSIRANLEQQLLNINERINKNNQDKIDALKEISDLTKGLNKLQKELGLSFDFTDYSASDKKEKSRVKTFINNQQQIAIAEVKYNRDRLLFLANTEEEKASIINASEAEILKIRKEFFIQNATAQGLNQEQSVLAWLEYKNDVLNTEVEGNKKLKAARDKDFDDLLDIEQKKQLGLLESLEGTLKIYDDFYTKEETVVKNRYADGITDEKQYLDQLNQVTLERLQAKLAIYKAFGKDVTDIENEIADFRIKVNKNTEDKLTDSQKEFAKNSSRAIRNAFNSLLSDIGKGLQESLIRAMQGTSEAAKISLQMLELKQKELEQIMNDARSSEMEILQARQQYLQNQEQIAEKSKDNLTQTFDTMLMAIGDFLVKLGSGLVAAAVASKAFQDLLIANPVAAIAAGAAAVALGTIVKATLTEGVAFANGGIVSGPTLGLVGEYPGASTNPEVIAPLDKLKNLLNISGNGNDGYIAETRVSGRDLAIVLNRYNQDSRRG